MVQIQAYKACPLEAGKRGLQRGLRARERTVILFADEVILTKIPPLRACWALEGHQACVPITGDRDRRILYGVLGVKQGSLLLHGSSRWTAKSLGYFSGR